MGVEIEGDGRVERFGQALEALGATRGRQVLARAVNRTASTARTQVVRAVVRQASIPRRIAVGQIRVRKASTRAGAGGDVEGVIEGTGSPIPLREFKARQFGYGVRVRLFGASQRMAGAFIFAGSPTSGQAVGGGHVFTRSTSASYPIKVETGPAVPEQMIRDQAADAFETTVAAQLPRRLKHELGRLVP